MGHGRFTTPCLPLHLVFSKKTGPVSKVILRAADLLITMQSVACRERAAASYARIAVIVWVATLCGLSFTAKPAFAQSSLNEVHINPPASQIQQSPVVSLRDAGLHTIRKSVDMVLVPVTVTDQMNRLVTGLDQSDFQLLEEKRPQEIKHFSSEDAPLSLGIVLDLSSSMSDRIEWARKAVIEFCKSANPADEFFLVTFADRPELITDFTQHTEDIQKQLLFVTPKGRTSLLDAIYLGINHMQQARYPKRALLVISDGGDNRSRYTLTEIYSLVKEADVMLYAIGIYDPTSQIVEQMSGPQLLDGIAKLTGGRAFPISSPDLLPPVAAMIGYELRNQYVLAYRPENTSRNGKWHKIQVKLRLPKTKFPLSVRAKMGYYAPTQ